MQRRYVTNNSQRRLGAHTAPNPLKLRRPSKYISDIIIPAHEPKPRFVRLPQAQKPVVKIVTRSKPKKKFASRTSLANVAIVLVLIMTGFLGYFAYQYKQAVQKVEAQPLSMEPEVVEAGATDEKAESQAVTAPANVNVSEAKPKAAPYTPKPNQPVKVLIPKIKVDAYISPVGDGKSGSMVVPSSTWVVGWYNKMASPSDNTGVTVLNGHVHGLTQKGVFYYLKDLKEGDTVTVVEGSGNKYNYKVVSSKVYKAGEIGGDLYSAISSKPGLNLVTCTGKVNKAGDGYEDRLVVYTERE